MRTRIQILTILLLFISELGFTAEGPRLKIESLGGARTLLSFELDTASAIDIKFMCNEGEILYHWKSKTPLEKIEKIFNLSELECGKYIVCINYGEKSIYKELNLNNNEIQFGPSVQLHEPYFQYSENKIKLSFLNSARRDVYLNVYQGNEFINQYALGRELVVQAIFNFSKLNDGEYDLVLSDFFTEHHFLVNK